MPLTLKVAAKPDSGKGIWPLCQCELLSAGHCLCRWLLKGTKNWALVAHRTGHKAHIFSHAVLVTPFSLVDSDFIRVVLTLSLLTQ